MGEDGFRKGLDLFFMKFDGMSAGSEDFRAALEEATGMDLSDMDAWFDQVCEGLGLEVY